MSQLTQDLQMESKRAKNEETIFHVYCSAVNRRCVSVAGAWSGENISYNFLMDNECMSE